MEDILKHMSDVPVVDRSIENYFIERVNCQTFLPRYDQAPLTFQIESRDDQMTDLKNVQICAKFLIKKRNPAGGLWVNLGQNEQVLPLNLFLYTFFGEASVDFQHRPLDRSYEFYGLQSYLKTLLYASDESKRRELKGALYHPDAAGAFDVIPAARADNPGAYERMASGSVNVTMPLQGKLLLDIFNIQKPLVDGVSVTIQLTPANPRKSLMAGPNAAVNNQVPPIEEYGVRIDQCFLLVPRIKVKPSLLKQVANYPWIKTETLKYILPAGVVNFGPRTIYTGSSIPKRAFVVLTREENLNGNLQFNTLKFDHFGVENMLMEINGEHRPYSGGYVSDFPAFDYTQLYNGLLYELNKQGDSGSVDITFEQFRAGYTIWCFDMSESKVSSSDVYAPSVSGSVNLSFRLSAGSQNNIAVLVFFEHERILSIDKNRNWEDRAAYSV